MLGILGGEGKQENKNEVQEMENYGAEAGSAVKLLEELLNLGYRKMPVTFIWNRRKTGWSSG